MADADKYQLDHLNRGAGAYSTPGVDSSKQEPEFVPRTGTPVTSFNLKLVDPPSNLYVRPPDVLNLRVNSLLAGGDHVVFNIRILRADGTIVNTQFFIQSTVPGVGVNVPVQLPEGYILSVLAGQCGASLRGTTFASATLQYNIQAGALATAEEVLISSYITSSVYATWPNGTIFHPLDNNGHLRSITGTVPAAGAEINEVVPVSTRWRILAFRYSLTTAVAVANRESNLQIDDGVNIYITNTSGFTEAATLTDTFSWMLGVSRLQALQSNVLTLPLPEIIVEAGHRIRTQTTNIQAADQYTAPQYLVEEWLTIG